MDNKVFRISRKYILSTICIILSFTLLLSIIGTAEVEINATLEDNLVILLDYSGSTASLRPYIQSNAIYSIHNIEADSNVSVVVYGDGIKNSNVYSTNTQDNRTILERFVRNITGKEGDVARDNIYEGFDEARKILYNSTGTKQIVLISDGNLDGNTSGKIYNAQLIELIKDLKKYNVTINFYQVLDTNISQTLKPTWVREPYRDLGDKINTQVIVLNQSEKIRFFKPMVYPEESPEVSPESYRGQLETDEYLNEFNNSGETPSITFSMNYDQNEALFYDGERDLSSAPKINFYSYCDQNQTCIIIPFDIQQRKFFDSQTLEDVFRSKNAIELVNSGNITESAYIFSNSVSGILCGFFDSDTFNAESTNLLGKALPLIEPKTTKAIKVLKWGGLISEVDYPMLLVSGECKISSDDKLLIEIINGGRYTYSLKKGYAYNGITQDFQIYNKGIMDDIEYRKKAYFGVLSLIYLLNVGVIDNAEPMVKNNNVKLKQLLTQDYKEDAGSASNRINYKSEESQIFINNATSELNDLNSQIPNSFREVVLNFIEEPETDYSMAKLRQEKADDYLNKAKENQAAYKFNSANQNSNYSMVQSREGMVFANMENSKQRHPNEWAWLFAGTAILLIVIAIIKLSSPP
ncbi:MAG: VWA domain-containing protein [Candidatus Methanoperedens sp.]|nr:VWA domain-containing protein [Candidatus Methanoperedens sp.]MCZ7371791.1 VWA domain-containing protein [Candidatus Methanoperedens sp.]